MSRVVGAVVRFALSPVRLIDRALIAHYGIFEFTDDPLCVLRVNLTPSPAGVVLRDGVPVSRGEVVAELHLWSDRSMRVGNGIDLRRRMERSFSAFGHFLQRDARFANVNAILIRTSACDQFPRPFVEKLAARWGFEVEARTRTAGNRFADFWDNVYIILLGLAYPSGRLRFRRRLERLRIWASRRRFLEFHA